MKGPLIPWPIRLKVIVLTPDARSVQFLAKGTNKAAGTDRKTAILTIPPRGKNRKRVFD